MLYMCGIIYILYVCFLISKIRRTQRSVAAWMRAEPGGEWIHEYVRLSCFFVHLTLSQRCSSAILQYKMKKFKRNKIRRTITGEAVRNKHRCWGKTCVNLLFRTLNLPIKCMIAHKYFKKIFKNPFKVISFYKDVG